jgi:hypothetical protein
MKRGSARCSWRSIPDPLRRKPSRSALTFKRRLRPSVAQESRDGVDSGQRTIWSWLAGNPRPRTVGPQSGFRNLRVIRSDAVTPITETRTNWRCFGAPRCTCRISSTVSTGSSPSTRRRRASVHPTPSSFASSLSPGEPLGSSSKSVWSKCCVKAGLAQGRDVEFQGQPGWADRPRGHQDRQDSSRRPQERSTVPNDPAESERFRWRIADRGPRVQERARFPRLCSPGPR